MFFKALKEKSIEKTIKKELSKESSFPSSGGVLRSLAIVINYDDLVDYKPLLNIAKAINISNENVFITGYVEKLYKNVNYMIPVFSKKSFGTRGAVKSEDLNNFLNREYDIVINYYTDSNIYLNLVSALIKSPMKVGISEENEAVNNLVLKVNEGDFSRFSDELVKYLSILKKI
ncbi:hypothetical protein OOZ15_08855 [Galbibacter sp. EGI 63066]|uniref:DUF6913 domain-containing protein n=1 Tax=Galbibacter sp. EGI 63066 TaxID=2993559 RepID=UPI0022496305|nr:hypothetical protein [Galbibacter sp. EGI 63066]MCX2680044.1 hypothetical protein [Galbibacter sp. EGI 63066]